MNRLIETARIRNLHNYNYIINDMNNKSLIEYRKMYSKLEQEARQKAKQSNCLYCNNSFTSFCNSHSIPSFVLKNISSNGQVYTTNIFTDIAALSKEKGIKKAGVFSLICNNCDNEVFKDYENPINYREEPSVKMLSQIALKNAMRDISKARFVHELEIAMKKSLIWRMILLFGVMNLNLMK